MSYPYELKYDTNHHWSRLNRDGTVTVGITIPSVSRLGGYGATGAIVRATLPAAGQQLAQGQAVGSIEGSEAVREIYAPIAGTVTQSNEDLAGSPLLVRDDPYGEGWLFAIKPTHADDLKALMDATAYEAYVG